MTRLRVLAILATVLVAVGGAFTITGGTSTSSGGCQAAAPGLLATVGTGLTVSGGGTLSRGQVVRSKGAVRVWLLAAEIDGPGIEAPGHVGVWSMPTLEPVAGDIASADDLARQFSRWPSRSGSGGANDLVGTGDTVQTVAEARACLP
ncbi:MAG TPA: hypothetical protein VM030_09040 [Acidimicrobiales bacterium]|nr:hypothetical protein [Acidimicrobiales bacterium]